MQALGQIQLNRDSVIRLNSIHIGGMGDQQQRQNNENSELNMD